MNIVAFIPARGGSKGVPMKNIKSLLGKPLIAYTIETAKKCKLIDRVIVSTENDKIREVANKYGAETPFIRPEVLAGDDVATAPVIKHAINYLESQEGYIVDLIVLLDATSPLRSVEDITACIKTLKNEKDVDAVVSVCHTHHNPYFNLLEYKKNGYAGLVIQRHYYPPSRQKAPRVFWVNSAVWAIRKEIFMSQGTFYPKKTDIHCMPEDRSFHVDTPYDFKLLEFMMKEKHTK